jgi:outer membrane immunogenic protein
MKLLFLALTAAASIASPAFSQAVTPSYTGAYVGGRIGFAIDHDRNSATVLFDKNLDGQFGDTVTTASGANAFSPGFCPGRPNSNMAVSLCRKDKGGIDYAINAGYDLDLGGVVIGGLVEYGRADIEDNVTAFSTTPASYTLTRNMKGTFGARARIGYNAGGVLSYLTAGVVRAKVRSSFSTSNTVNAFATQDASNSNWGYRVGGGVEKRLGNIAIGAQYLYTSVKDKDFRVNVTRGTAGVTNPFILTNANGTQFRRSDDRFSNHSLAMTANYRFQ